MRVTTIIPIILLPIILLGSLNADVRTSFAVEGPDAESIQVSWTNLGGAVTTSAVNGTAPVVNGGQNTFSQPDATGSISLNVSARASTASGFNPLNWSGGATTEIHTSNVGWGVTGDINSNIQAGEALLMEFDLSGLNLAPGDKLVWTQVELDISGSGRADVWRKRAGASQGELVSFENSGLSESITIKDGDTFALTRNEDTMRFVDMTLDIVLDNPWESDIVYLDQNQRLTYEANKNGQRIVDFSYAGYRAGEEPIPDVLVVLTISPVGGDNTNHIQNAINTVAGMPLVDGHRGAILLKSGTYPVNGIIYIHTDGIVLRGVGQGNTLNDTIILGTGTNRRKELGIIVIKSNTSLNRKEGGTEQNIVSEFIPAGSRSLEVEDASMYSVGGYMVIEHQSTHEWLMAVNYGNTYGDTAGEWGDSRSEDMFFHGTITAIDGNKIKLDTPIYHELDRSLAQATIYRHPGTGIVEECGVENLRVAIDNNGGTDESHSWDAVHFIGARNCWAKDTTAINFAESGFRFSRSARSTVINCSALEPVSQIDGGRRYNFYIGEDTHDILVKQCRATYGRHCYVGNGAAGTNGIVFTQSTSDDTYSSSENHRRWGSAFLWDAMTWSRTNTGGPVLALYNRGNSGTAHGWTGTGFVAWNVNTWGQNPIICSEPPIGQNFAIGCNANVTGADYPDGHIESSNGEMELPSLYEAQLAERLSYGVGPDMPGRLRVFHYTKDASPLVVLEWLDIALEETAYVLERATGGSQNFSVIATLPADTASYTDTSVAHNGTYTYRLSAINSIGRSAYSNPTTVDLSSVELPEVVAYQPLEDTVWSGCSFRWDRHNYTGKGYIDMGTRSSWFEMEIDGGKGGPTQLTFRYGGAAPSSGAAERPCNISVNGVTAGQTTFATPSSSWEFWYTEAITVNLEAGINTIRVQPSVGYGPNVDRIDVRATPVVYAAGESAPAQTAKMAFDSDNSTQWHHASPRGSWIQLAYPLPLEVADYALTSSVGENANDPADWQLLGSNDDGSTWTVLDTRSNQTFSSRIQTKTYSVSNAGSYSLYRLDISQVRDLANADSVQLAELSFSVSNLPPVTPNPAQFAEAPYPTRETEVSMTSVTGSSSLGAVEYYFTETSGNPGGTDSGWISSTSYTDTGLSAGVQYTYTVTMRDDPENVGAASNRRSATTYLQETISWEPPAGSDGKWTTGANWSGGVAPLSAEQYLKLRFSDEQEAILDQTAVVSQMTIGSFSVDLFEKVVTLTAGANLTAGLKPFGDTDWTAIGYSNWATLNVDAGAVFTATGNLWVGFIEPSIGKLIVNGGTVHVDGQFGLGWNGGTGTLELRMGTVHLSRMDAARSISGASSIDIQSGSLIIDGDETTTISNYVSTNKITAFGGTGNVLIDYDAQNDQTTVTAVSPNTIVYFESPPTTLLEGESLQLRVNATDSDGIDRVFLYKNGDRLSRSEGGRPYDFGEPGQNDTELENLQPGVYEFRAVARDLLGNEGEATISVTVLESIAKINFQPATAAIPLGYLPDASEVFGDRVNGFNYGWGSSFDMTRDRDTHPDQRYDTFNRTQLDDADRVWEIELNNGDYLVNMTGGDPNYDDSFIEFMAEAGTANAVTLMSGDTAGVNFISESATVTVSDGRLTISNGPNGVNNKISFVDIYRISFSDPYKAWKATHSLTDDLADEDNDGIKNLLEFALGSDPRSAESGQLPEASMNGSNLEIKLQRQEASVTYVIEKSTDLIGWVDYRTVTDSDGSVGGEATVSVPNSEANNGKLFLRLSVEK
jgi:hypothetical protein